MNFRSPAMIAVCLIRVRCEVQGKGKESSMFKLFFFSSPKYDFLGLCKV